MYRWEQQGGEWFLRERRGVTGQGTPIVDHLATVHPSPISSRRWVVHVYSRGVPTFFADSPEEAMELAGNAVLEDSITCHDEPYRPHGV